MCIKKNGRTVASNANQLIRKQNKLSLDAISAGRLPGGWCGGGKTHARDSKAMPGSRDTFSTFQAPARLNKME